MYLNKIIQKSVRDTKHTFRPSQADLKIEKKAKIQLKHMTWLGKLIYSSMYSKLYNPSVWPIRKCI